MNVKFCIHSGPQTVCAQDKMIPKMPLLQIFVEVTYYFKALKVSAAVSSITRLFPFSSE